MDKITPTTTQVADTVLAVMRQQAVEIASIAYGEWSSTFSFRIATGEYIIRFSPLDDDFRSDAFAVRFSSPKLPIPRIIHIGEAYGGYFAISEKTPGVPLDLQPADQMKQMVPAVLDLLDALRCADVSGSRGCGGWTVDGDGRADSWQDSLLHINADVPGSRLAGWRAKLETSHLDAGWFDVFYRRFAEMVKDCPEIRHLIHADLLHFNVLVDQGRISAVLDWGCARYGDFLYELAWFTFWGDWLEPMRGIDWRSLARAYFLDHSVDLPDFDRRLAAYELHIGLDSVVYCSFTENWEMAEQVLQQMEGIKFGMD